MNKKRFLLFLALLVVVLLLHSSQCLAQDDWDNPDPGGDIPIPGIIYFLAALLGIGLKKIYNARKKD